MKTKVLMVATVAYLGISGIGLTFLPQEILSFFSISPDTSIVLFLQIIGAMYLGFAMMNWISRNGLIGGIYNRPLVLGNFIHFVVSAFALIKVVNQFEGSHFGIMITITILYVIFGLSFGFLLRASPV
ncbi:MAG: hypothetical protein ACFHWX_14245 [Bacteroidota bacterium]